MVAIAGIATVPASRPSIVSVAAPALPSRSTRTATLHRPAGSGTSDSTRVCAWK